MDSFKQDALRTESTVFNINPVNVKLLHHAMVTAIHHAKAMDMLKKNIFYGKPVDEGHLTEMVMSKATLLDPAVTEISEDAARLIHAGMGLNTESVEFLEAIYAHVFDGAELDFINLKEELGDMLWYQAIAVDDLGTSFKEEGDRVIAKLKARYPEKFDESLAENRDLDAERKVLEGNANEAKGKDTK